MTEEPHVDAHAGGIVIKLSLRMEGAAVRAFITPARVLALQLQHMTSPASTCTDNDLCTSPKKCPLPPESVSCKHSASPKRRRLPDLYTKLTIVAPSSPLTCQMQEAANCHAWDSTWDPCSYTSKAQPGGASIPLDVIASAQLLAETPCAPETTDQQPCTPSNMAVKSPSTVDHVSIIILDTKAIDTVSPATRNIVRLVLLLDGEVVHAVITPTELAQPSLHNYELSSSGSFNTSQVIPAAAGSNTSPFAIKPLTGIGSGRNAGSSVLAFNASVKMLGSTAHVHLELLDSHLASAAHAACASSSSRANATMNACGNKRLEALQLPACPASTDPCILPCEPATSSRSSNSAVSDKKVLVSTDIVDFPEVLKHAAGRRACCRGDAPVTCDGSGSSEPTLCNAVGVSGPIADQNLELQGWEGMSGRGQSANLALLSTPMLFNRPAALQLPGSQTISLFAAGSGSRNSSCDLIDELEPAPCAPGAGTSSAYPAPLTLERNMVAAHNPTTAFLARAMHSVVGSMFARGAPCLGMDEPAAAHSGMHRSTVPQASRRRSMHGMRSNRAGREDGTTGDVWVHIRTGSGGNKAGNKGNKAGSGVGKLVRKLSSMPSREDSCVNAGDQ